MLLVDAMKKKCDRKSIQSDDELPPGVEISTDNVSENRETSSDDDPEYEPLSIAKLVNWQSLEVNKNLKPRINIIAK